jgi:hypothetical protein
LQIVLLVIVGFLMTSLVFAVRLPRSDKLAFMSANREEEPSESLEEMEAQTIGNLLPDEDDLFAEVVGEGVHKSRANGGDDLDDCDLFSSVGGMELDGDVFSSVSQRDGKRGSNVSTVAEHPQGEILSRILFVRNVDSSIEDCELGVLFKVRNFTCVSGYRFRNYGKTRY